MASYTEKNTIKFYDKLGNEHKIYPKTTVDQVVGLESKIAELQEDSKVVDTYGITGTVGANVKPQNMFDVIGNFIKNLAITTSNFANNFKARLKNDLNTTTEGYALDARQGKVISQQISALNTSVEALEQSAEHMIAAKIVLDKDDWVNNTQSITVEGMQSEDDMCIFVCPFASSTETYVTNNIICNVQGIDTLGFKCDTVPNVDVEIYLVLKSATTEEDLANLEIALTEAYEVIQRINASSSTAQSNISALNTQNQTASNNISSLQSLNQTAAGRIDSLTSANTTASSNIESITDANNLASTNIDDLTEELSKVSESIESIQSATSTANEVLSDLTDENTTAGTVLNNLTSANNTASDNISTLGGLNTTSDSYITQLTTANSTASDNIGLLSQANIDAQENIDSMTALVDSGTTVASQLSGEMDTVDQKVQTLNTAISTASDKIISLEEINDEANDTISSLTSANSTATDNISTLSTANNTASNNISSLATSNATASQNLTDLDTANNNATTAKTNLDRSITDAGTAKQNLDSSISTANTTKTSLDTSIDTASNQNTLAQTNIANLTSINSTANDTIDELTELNQTASQNAQGIAGAIQNANTAATNAQNVADTVQAQLEGGYLKGEKGDKGDNFAIYKTYSSIANMNADASNVPEGKFVMIASTTEDVDNAKLYVKGANEFSYISDLSGSQGVQGEPGVSPTVTTTNQGNTHVINITDVDGSHSITLLDGEKGDRGSSGMTAIHITLLATDWVNLQQTKTITGIIAENQQAVFVCPYASSTATYVENNIICTSQSTDTLVFSCDTTPIEDVDIYIIIKDTSTVEDLNNLELALSDATIAIQTIQSENATASTNVNNLQLQNSTASTNISSITSLNQTAATRIDNLTTANGTATTTLSELTSANETASSNITRLDGQLNSADTNLSALSTANTTAESNISDLQSEITSASSNISSLTIANNTATNNINTLDGINATADQNISDINTATSDGQEVLGHLSSMNTTANETLSDLQEANDTALATIDQLDLDNKTGKDSSLESAYTYFGIGSTGDDFVGIDFNKDTATDSRYRFQVRENGDFQLYQINSTHDGWNLLSSINPKDTMVKYANPTLTENQLFTLPPGMYMYQTAYSWLPTGCNGYGTIVSFLTNNAYGVIQIFDTNGNVYSRHHNSTSWHHGWQTLYKTPIHALAQVTTGGDTTYTGKIVFNNVLQNYGNCYNTSTGEFTCPVNGVYAMSFGYYSNNTAANSRPAIMVNGSMVTMHNGPYGHDLSITRVCAAGDKITAGAYGSNYPVYLYAGGGHNHFSVTLIQQIP